MNRNLIRKSISKALLIALGCSYSNLYAAQPSDSVKSLQIWQDSSQASQGKARVEITSTLKPGTSQTFIVNGEKTTFNDTGTTGDLKKGDGIFSATITFDTVKLITDVLSAGQRAPEEIVKSTIKFPMFQGRTITTDKAQILHTEAIVNDATLNKRLNTLTSLSRSLGSIKTPELLAKLGVDPKVVPIVRIINRPALDQLIDLVGIPLPAFSTVLPTDISASHSLMITNLGVIEDPNRTFDVCKPAGQQGNPSGVWSFGYVMRRLAQGTGQAPEQFALNWLNTWSVNQTINSFSVPARPNVQQLLTSWQLASPNQIKNVDYFPARLLAIANRPDIGKDLLGGGGSYGGGAGLKRGEARLVFELLQKNTNGTCNTLPFTVIFEYNTPTNSCQTIKNWQKNWKNLSQFTVGSASYNTALANITTAFTPRTQLAQLRTNENALNPIWELREFFLPTATAGLTPTTVAETPDLSFNNTPFLANFVTGTWINTETVPLTVAGIPFRAGSALIPSNNLNFHWDYPGSTSNPLLRHRFSLNTCNACHTGETSTLFTHIGNLGKRNNGQETTLSRFLTGKNVVTTLNPFNPNDIFSMNDPPAATNLSLNYNDIARRQSVMAGVLNTSCGLVGVIPAELLPMESANFNMVH